MALPDTNTRLTLTGTVLTIGLGKTDVVEEAPGGSIVVRTASGELKLAAEAPTLTVAGSAPIPGTWRVTGRRLSAAPADGQQLPRSRAVRVSATVGTALVASVGKQSWQGKPRWLITPTELGRTAPLTVLTAEGWAQARRAGGIPDTASLKNQFVCHPTSGVARSKPSWNIEAARDASNFLETMAAGCNP
ncbi:DUF2599 domain-containing protein [Luteococcus sp. H138]|uniref:DUF2599 domain-containing protein n=1 Tax=unclassified Luteococcus TaxID=2639923 RepID=UPI00313B34CC